MTDDPFAEAFAAPKKRTVGNVTYHDDVEQGSEAWLECRRGLITASEAKLLVTPTLKVADNDKTRAHLFELAAQRISKYVEPTYIGDDMMRGHADEVDAKILYSQHFAQVRDSGFVTNSKWGFTLGWSPDGLVGDDGAVECKSRRQKFQIQTIIENVGRDRATTIPADYLIQHQTGLLVGERNWIDFISYSGGLPMVVIRVHPDARVQEAILEAAADAEKRVAKLVEEYEIAAAGLIPTERRIQMEMFA